MLVTESSKLYYSCSSNRHDLALPSLKLIIEAPCKPIRVDPASAHLFFSSPRRTVPRWIQFLDSGDTLSTYRYRTASASTGNALHPLRCITAFLAQVENTMDKLVGRRKQGREDD